MVTPWAVDCRADVLLVERPRRKEGS